MKQASLFYICSVLSFWFVTSAVFNDCTPRLLRALTASGGIGGDVTVLELFITWVIGIGTVRTQGARLSPPPALRKKIAAFGALHLTACRLFILSLEYAPVALIQTIRGTNPFWMVIWGTLFLGRRYRAAVLGTIVPICGGFALAVLDSFAADTSYEKGLVAGVLAAAGSVVCLVAVYNLSNSTLANSAHVVTSAELQYWACSVALMILLPPWICGGGIGRIVQVFARNDNHLQNAGLTILNGSLHWAEHRAQFEALALLTPLSVSIVDTVRRLWIVVIAGYALQGDRCTWTNVIGACLVCAGAASYAVMNDAASNGRKPALSHSKWHAAPGTINVSAV